MSEIPDSVSAELEKLEQEDNTGMGEVEGVGDLLGELDDDDAELLDSLTAEMGDHFNILEYADPELDTTDGEKSNLLDSLELDDEAKDGDAKTRQKQGGENVDPSAFEKMDDANKQQQQQQVGPGGTIAARNVAGPTGIMQQHLTGAGGATAGQNTMQSNFATAQGQMIQQQQNQQMQPQQQFGQQQMQMTSVAGGQQKLMAGNQIRMVRPNLMGQPSMQQMQQQQVN